MKMKISTLRNVIKEVLETVAGQDDAAEFDAALAAYANDWKNFTRETPEVDPVEAAEAAADGFFYDNPGWQKWSIGTGMSREDMAQAVVDAVYSAMMNGPVTEATEKESEYGRTGADPGPYPTPENFWANRRDGNGSYDAKHRWGPNPPPGAKYEESFDDGHLKPGPVVINNRFWYDNIEVMDDDEAEQKQIINLKPGESWHTGGGFHGNGYTVTRVSLPLKGPPRPTDLIF